MLSFANAFDNLFDDMFDRKITNYYQNTNLIGKTDIQEDDNSYLIHVDAPGFNKKDFEINVDGRNIVTIHGKKQENKEEKDKDNKKYVLKERKYEEFNRSFQLPEEIKKEDIQAQYVDGVLMIHIPKIVKEEAKIQKIEVQ